MRKAIEITEQLHDFNPEEEYIIASRISLKPATQLSSSRNHRT